MNKHLYGNTYNCHNQCGNIDGVPMNGGWLTLWTVSVIIHCGELSILLIIIRRIFNCLTYNQPHVYGNNVILTAPLFRSSKGVFCRSNFTGSMVDHTHFLQWSIWLILFINLVNIFNALYFFVICFLFNFVNR